MYGLIFQTERCGGEPRKRVDDPPLRVSSLSAAAPGVLRLALYIFERLIVSRFASALFFRREPRPVFIAPTGARAPLGSRVSYPRFNPRPIEAALHAGENYAKRGTTVPVTPGTPALEELLSFAAILCHIERMHVARKTNQELIVIDGSIWLSVFFLCAAAFIAVMGVTHNMRNWWVSAGLFTLFAFIAWRRETVTFDAAAQQVRWIRHRAFRLASGTIAFSDMRGITLEAMNTNRNVPSYRLTILTTGKPVPMSDGYGGGQAYYESLRKEILKFIEMDETASPGPGDEESIRALLEQGRKIDAVEFARKNYQLDLAEAVDRVNEIDQKIKAAQ